MTVPWSAIQAAITRFVQSTGVVDDDHVLWDREAAKLVLHESSIELRIASERSIGFDDYEEVETSPGVYEQRLSGLREFTLSMRFRARSPEDAYAARDSLETIRASLHHPDRVDILSEAGIAFLTTEMLETRDVVHQGRWEQIAALDVRMSVLSTMVDVVRPDAFLAEVEVSENGQASVVIGA
jgi:hypothetical protein